MTIWSGWIKSRASSDFERTGLAEAFLQLFVNSLYASLSTSTRVRFRSRATERPIVPTPE